MTASIKVTPMLQQYLEIKEQHQDAILFYRMGDFYEMFFEDAEIASKILGITLTSRNNRSDTTKVPMCGIPYHAVQTYLAKLVKAGRRVAICEQVENPAEAKGIVKREVIRIVSPGVVTDEGLLDDKESNYLCALTCRDHGGQKKYGLSLLEATTGEFMVGEHAAEDDRGTWIIDQLTRFTPSEILVGQDDRQRLGGLLDEASTLMPGLCITERSADGHDQQAMLELLCNHFGVATLDGYGCGSFTQGVVAAGIVLAYLQETQKTSLDHVNRLQPLPSEAILQIDDASRRNLELTQTLIGAKREGSLLFVLDQTCTPMGARLLKHDLLCPLQDRTEIQRRLEAVAELVRHPGRRQQLRRLLDAVYDLERLTSRMILGSGNGRDMLAMMRSLQQLPAIEELISTCSAQIIAAIADTFDALADLCQLIEQAINPDAPVTLRDGNLIREGYHQELDELIAIQRDGKKTIAGLETTERERSGLAKLKVGFNKVFGYYFEVSRIHAEKLPDHYIRKQTLVNAERFITPELKEFESKVLGAQERRLDLEYELFTAIRNHIASQSQRLLKTAQQLARLDVFASLAEVAQRYNYCRPTITDDPGITIREGRHPVIERALPSGRFVPNDMYLDQAEQQLLIITGPNMAGKSTVLRQTALIVLLAQMGSFVPAAQADIGIVDKIFTRVGAMDDLRRGQSTFMVEMSETANILNNATPRSLVILDEIGRGTSTYDGLSIAWAVAEDLVLKNDLGVKTLFATHYHELTDLARTMDRVKNFSIAVKEWSGSIIFLHKLVEGGASRSYGIQVAALAGVPQQVVERAQEILHNIEKGEFDQSGQPAIAHTTKARRKKSRSHPGQLSLFTPPADPVRHYLEAIDADQLTPRQALDILYTLKTMLSEPIK